MARHQPLPLLVSLSCFIRSGAFLHGGGGRVVAPRLHILRPAQTFPVAGHQRVPYPSTRKCRRLVGTRSLVSVAAQGLETTTGLGELLQPRNGVNERYVFFGGKGGVGKTSTAAAVAIQCADSGLRTLVISTDPAHSLGDALDQDVSGGKPIRVMGLDNLQAMETADVRGPLCQSLEHGFLVAVQINTDEAVREFEEALAAFDVTSMAMDMGISEDMVQNLGLSELSDVLKNPPPGIDELVALSRVLKLTRSEEEGSFDRIIIDTAPTGHTLRLLSFPDFLDSFLEKVIQLRSRIGGLLNMFKTMMGTGDTLIDKVDTAVEKLQGYKEQIVELQQLFRNHDATEFCIVAIPTQLAIAESKRLLGSLRDQGVAVRNIVVNQVVEEASTSDYLSRLRKGQEVCMGRIDKMAVGATQGLDITRVPFFDMEVSGVYPLRYMAQVAFGGPNTKNWAELSSREGQRFVVVGGKGGVGKTSSSAALAVKMADDGYNTVIVSTDPAHSLGDALQMPLRGAGLTLVPGMVGAGSLYALEVDTEAAVQEYKKVIDTFMKKTQQRAEQGDTTSGILSQLKLEDFADVLDNAPPGTDELVALSKVLRLVRGDNERGLKFDRVIIDTAPTGHTLRMLSYPEFLDNFFEKLIKIRNKMKGATAVMNMFSGGGFGGATGGGEDDKDIDEDRDRLRDFQFNMMELQDLFRNEEKSEFVVVTIPSVLAVAESERLVVQLKEQEVPVKHLIVNKVVTEDVQDGYIDRLSRGQAAGVAELQGVAGGAGVYLTTVPYFDVEVRNVYGLRFMAQTLFSKR